MELERLKLNRQYYFTAFELVVYLMLTILVGGLAFFDRSDPVYAWVA